mgnify:CR=1 FL=1
MNKFEKLIGNNGSETLQQRAKVIAQTAEIAQQNLVNKLNLHCSLGSRISLNGFLFCFNRSYK